MSRSQQRPNWIVILRQLLCSCCNEETETIKCLDLSHSLLSEIPPEVFQCQRTLETLHLDSNHVAELPRQLFNCDELRELSISDNEISFIPPAIAFLQNLQKFDVSKNAVTTLPDNIRQCASLTYMDLSINPLERLPEGLVNIASLQELYLTDAYLEFLPANFGKLVNLRILELRENNLSTLPKTMSRLVHLTRLDIGFNEFQDLPEVVSSLQNLTELWIDGNHIKKLNPSIGQLRKMIHFDASQNNLVNLPRDVGYWTKVQEFYMSNNELENLPSSIGNLINLIRLKLEENSLKCLPDTIGKLTNLEELMLTHNYLSHLPGSVGLLRKLKILDVDKNYLIDIPAELGSCVSLSILSLRENRLLEIPAEIGHLSSLKVLNLVDNVIKYLPMSILKLESLSALWLSNNQSQPLMPLQQEKDLETNTSVLTCFMLPQQRTPHLGPGPSAPDEFSHRPRVAPRHIYFAPNTGTPYEQPGRLTRAPTPYPKELRALAKHAKQVQKNLAVPQPKSGERVTPQAQSSLEIKEATVKVGISPSSHMGSAATSPRPVETLSEPIVSSHAHPREITTTPTQECSISSLPLAYESTPVIREAKNIRTDTQTSTVVHNPTPQLIQVAPASGKKAILPPPYHIAAAYSVKAQFFNPESTSNQPVAGDSNDQLKVTSASTSTSGGSSQQSGLTSTRRLYSGRDSFPYSNVNESIRTESSELSASEASDSQKFKSVRISPLPVSSDENDIPRTVDLSHFVTKSTLDQSKTSTSTSISEEKDTSSERNEQTTCSSGHYSANVSERPFDLNINKQETPDSKGTSQSVSDEVGKASLSSEPPSDYSRLVTQGSISYSEARVPRSIHSLDSYLNKPSSSYGAQRSSVSLGTYSIKTESDMSNPSTCTDYSIHRPHINLDQFVSSETSNGMSSSTAVCSAEQSEFSSSGEQSSRLSFHLLTPPFPQVSSSVPLVPIEESASGKSSDPMAGSVECDMGDSQELNLTDPSTDSTSLRFHVLTHDKSSATTVTGDTRSSTQTSGVHGRSSIGSESKIDNYPSQSGSLAQSQRRTSRDTSTKNGSSSTHSEQSTQVSSAQGSHSAANLDPASYALTENRSGSQSLSTHFPYQTVHSSQVFSSRSSQTSHPMSVHSHSPFSDSPSHSGRTFRSLTPQSFFQAYMAQAQGIYRHSPHSSQSLSPAQPTPPSYLSSRSGYSSYFPCPTQIGPQSIPSGHSLEQSSHVSVSNESDGMDNSTSESRTSNLNETFTRTLHPCGNLDNDNASAGDHENNFENKPRFFVQDKPSPGQNVVAPTPKRPSVGDKTSRIPYLTSPTMRRTGYTPSEFASQISSLQTVAVSPRSARRDSSVREVKSDTSIAAGGTMKTKIPAPNSKPVSPESSCRKKWVFGYHRNATVMNVLIHKNPDLGFSITEIPGKGIFIDDVKDQECLSVGDKILEVEGIDVTVLHKEEVMEILLAAGRHICMMISHI